MLQDDAGISLKKKIETLAADIQTHPQFQRVARDFVVQLLGALKGPPLLGVVTASQVNFVVVSYICYLHHFRDREDPRSGVTSTAVRDYCVEHDVCGSRHALTILNAMRLIGFLDSAKLPQDSRVKILSPSLNGMSLLRDVHLSYAEAYKTLFDDERPLNFMQSDIEATVAIVAHCFRSWSKRFGTPTQAMFKAYPFFDRINAVKLVLSAYLTMDKTAMANAQYGTLSEMFGSSRSHVQKLFAEAEANGFVTIFKNGGQKIRLEPKLIEGIEHYTAMYIAIMYHAANLAMDEARFPQAG